MTGLAEQLRAIELVGPKGYEHGWHFVGIPAIGTKIRMPGGRLGEVIGGDHQHARIRTANGDIFKIPHDKGPGAARLVKDTAKPEPAPYPKLAPERMKMKLAADKSIAAGETLFHGTNHQFKPGDIIDAQHSRRGVTMLHEGKQYAFASTDPGEATFAGRVGREGHVYRVEPVGQHEYDPHQGSATSRRTSGGFRVVEEVQQWSGKAIAPARKASATEKRAYVKTGKLPPGVTLATAGLAEQLIELAFDPHELRIPRGQPRAGEWVHVPHDKPGTGIHRYVVPDPERLVIPPPKKAGRKNYYVRPEDHPFFQAHPLSVKNILAAYDRADEGTRAQGRDWYKQNHEVAKIIGGGNAEEGAILLSAYTAQKPWPYNMFQAMKSFNRGKALGPGEGMAITGDNQKTAQAALDGAGIDEALHGPKTHSFAVLLAQGDDSPDDPYGHVVIDTHALNVAAGGTVRGDEGDKAPIGGPRYHQYVADLYREAARQVSEREGKLMKPHQLQAITWMVQQQASQAADAAAAASGRLTKGELGRARGRVNMTKNAWKVWMAYAKKHNVQLVPGLSSLSGQVALAQLIELTTDGSLSAQLADLAAWEGELRDPKGEWTRTPGGNARRVRRHITASEARGNSRPVSMDEYQHLAALGNRWIDTAKRDASPATGLDEHWDKIKSDAYAEARKPWGGATIDAHTGVPVKHNADVYALSVKPAHMHTISVPETATQDEFNAAMDQARELFRPALERKAFHLGVFHDDENHRIDMDPVAIVGSPELVEQVGAYTRAIGGAYHFKTGNGHWPPHVASGADMAADENENTIHWLGPGQWHSQAVEIQEPEPADEPIDE